MGQNYSSKIKEKLRYYKIKQRKFADSRLTLQEMLKRIFQAVKWKDIRQ